MRRIILTIIVLMVARGAYALDAMSDSDLDIMTGQAGVTIVFSNLEIQSQARDLAWGDLNQQTVGVNEVKNNYSWFALDADDETINRQTFNGVIKIDTVSADAMATVLDGMNGVTPKTGIVIDANMEMTSTGGQTVALELNETEKDVYLPDPRGIMGDTEFGATRSSGTLGEMHSSESVHHLDAVIVIMPH